MTEPHLQPDTGDRTITVPFTGLPVTIVAMPDTSGGYDYLAFLSEREAVLHALSYLGDDMAEADMITDTDVLYDRADTLMDRTGDYVVITNTVLFP
jgi:hypothetical protein